MDTSSWQGFIAPCKFALSSRHIEKISSNRCLVELVNPQEKQGNKICRRIMLFLSNINSECSIPGSVSPLLQPKQPLATWKCLTNRHPMICEDSATSRISNPELWFQPHSNMYWSFRIIRHVPKRKHKTSLKPPVNPRSGKLLIQ